MIKDIIKNNKNNYEEYLKDYEIAKKVNSRSFIINYLLTNICKNEKVT